MCNCEERPACWVCLESELEGGDLLRACACKGSAGYVHVECIVDYNKHHAEQKDQCPTCKQRYIGVAATAIAEARVHKSSSSSAFDGSAVGDLARALLEHVPENMPNNSQRVWAGVPRPVCISGDAQLVAC